MPLSRGRQLLQTKYGLIPCIKCEESWDVYGRQSGFKAKARRALARSLQRCHLKVIGSSLMAIRPGPRSCNAQRTSSSVRHTNSMRIPSYHVVYALSITRHCRRSLSACLCESSHSVRPRSRPDSLHQRSGGKRRWTIRCAAYRGNYSDKLRGERARQRYTRTIHDSMKVSRSRLHFCEERQRRTLTPVTP